MNCTRCSGTGFLNAEQIPDHVDQSPESVLDWLAEYHADRVGQSCSCHINPPCHLCESAVDVSVCDCCGDGDGHYGTPGQHYGNSDPPGRSGPYAYNGGRCECD